MIISIFFRSRLKWRWVYSYLPISHDGSRQGTVASRAWWRIGPTHWTRQRTFYPPVSCLEGQTGYLLQPTSEDKDEEWSSWPSSSRDYWGDKLDTFGSTRANTAALEMIRLFINSMVSERAQMMTLDIRNFYLGTPMSEPVYMFINVDSIPKTLSTNISYGT